MNEERRRLNDLLRQGWGKGPLAEAQRQEEDKGRAIDDLDEQIAQEEAQITQRQAQLDRLIERRDSMLFENGGKDAKG